MEPTPTVKAIVIVIMIAAMVTTGLALYVIFGDTQVKGPAKPPVPATSTLQPSVTPTSTATVTQQVQDLLPLAFVEIVTDTPYPELVYVEQEVQRELPVVEEIFIIPTLPLVQEYNTAIP